MKQEERIARDIDKRDMSRDAMRSLLRFAQSQSETGIGGGLPLDEVQNAKEYFYTWHRRKPFIKNKLIFFLLSVLTVSKFLPTETNEIFIFIVIFLSVIGTYVYLELDKRKSVYIAEMGGNLSQFKQSEREYYRDGLRHELWGIESEEINKKAITSIFFFTSVAIAVSLFSESDKLLQVPNMLAYISLIIFFMMDLIKVKKVKER